VNLEGAALDDDPDPEADGDTDAGEIRTGASPSKTPRARHARVQRGASGVLKSSKSPQL
jgi:hypothetical protein